MNAACPICTVPVIITVSAYGARVPVDATPSRFGHLELTIRNIAREGDEATVYSREVPESFRAGRTLHLSHACPDQRPPRAAEGGRP